MADDSKWTGEERRSTPVEKWHVGKEIPLAVLFTLILQTGGGIWWLAQVSAKIDSAVATIAEFRLERYTKDDARRDRELFLQFIEQQRQADREHERRLVTVEDAIRTVRR